jgi:hypothetical protein
LRYNRTFNSVSTKHGQIIDGELYPERVKLALVGINSLSRVFILELAPACSANVVGKLCRSPIQKGLNSFNDL